MKEREPTILDVAAVAAGQNDLLKDEKPPQNPKTSTDLEHARTFAQHLASLDAKLSLCSSKHTITLVYTLSNIIAFFFEAIPEYHRNGNDKLAAWVIGVARGCGNVLNLNFALIILMAARYSLTLLRTTPLNLVVPFDQVMPDFHMAIAILSFVVASLHSIMHLIVGFMRGTWAAGFGKWTYSFATGVLLTIACSAMGITSLEHVRRQRFEVFYYSHISGAVLGYILLILHGKRY